MTYKIFFSIHEISNVLVSNNIKTFKSQELQQVTSEKLHETYFFYSHIIRLQNGEIKKQVHINKQN